MLTASSRILGPLLLDLKSFDFVVTMFMIPLGENAPLPTLFIILPSPSISRAMDSFGAS